MKPFIAAWNPFPKISTFALFCTVVALPSIFGFAQSPVAFEFVVPGDDAAPTATDRSGLLHKPAGKHGFVQRDGNKFTTSAGRIRFWGANVCFAANFPTHEEADRLAPHLAKLGMNAIRFHHMDMQAAPNGIWDPNIVDGQRKLSTEMVDRLDYFLAKLHENGIYADLNLHVSRTLTAEEGYPQLGPGAPWWASSNKWVMYYDKDVQSELKEYCRDFLLHKNPYRDNLRRVDDPGIALVEMLNENYFSVQGYELYRRLPERFQLSFITAWNNWLKSRYGTHEKMMAAWQSSTEELGEPMVVAEDFKSLYGSWELSKPESEMPIFFGVAGPSDANISALRIAPLKVFEQDYAQQLRFPGLSVVKDAAYSLSFWVRSDEPRNFRAELATSAGGEWRSLGLFETIKATPEWTKITRVVIPGENISNEVSLTMTVGMSKIPIEFAGIELRPGVADQPLPAGQNLDEKGLIIPESGWPVAAHEDMQRFMVEQEAAWVGELKSFLIEEVGVRVPITASQVNYHPADLVESKLDFVDLHNYWHHPLFPSGQNWSAEKWTIQNEPMEANPTRSKWPANSLLMRTGWRYMNQPMTLSEWNYPEPSYYGAGCVPMAAILAGLQDWDGVFFFDYDSFSRRPGSEQFFRTQTDSYFSFNGQPVKLAVLSQFANVFLRGDLESLEDEAISDPANPIDGRYAFSAKIGVSNNADTSEMQTIPDSTKLATPTRSLVWNNDGQESGYLLMDTAATKAVWGTIAEKQIDIGDLRVETGKIEPNYGFVIVSTTDGLATNEAAGLVVTTASYSENIDMGWNEDKTSVGTDWGKGPTQVTSVPAVVSFPHEKADSAKIYALDGTGKRLTKIDSSSSDGRIEFTADPSHKTIWYEVSFDD